jgi:hypothetical protein
MTGHTSQECIEPRKVNRGGRGGFNPYSSRGGFTAYGIRGAFTPYDTRGGSNPYRSRGRSNPMIRGNLLTRATVPNWRNQIEDDEDNNTDRHTAFDDWQNAVENEATNDDEEYSSESWMTDTLTSRGRFRNRGGFQSKKFLSNTEIQII